MTLGGMRFLRLGLGLCVLICVASWGAAVAAAEEGEPTPKPPLYDGGLQFSMIHGPTDPEDYSRRVQLGPEQELVQVDDRTADVLHPSGHRAWRVGVSEAHDANGATVPMTLAVVDTDVVIFTVHHKAGNPAAAGAPFDYPISGGPGWEGGFSTVTVIMPPGETGPVAEPRCVVPRLASRSLAATKVRLKDAGCRLGKVLGQRSRSARVVKQFRSPGTVLASGAKVAVKLG